MLRYQKTLLDYFQIVCKNKVSLTIFDAFQLLLLKPYIYFKNFMRNLFSKRFKYQTNPNKSEFFYNLKSIASFKNFFILLRSSIVQKESNFLLAF